MAYLLDANVFIAAKNLHYGFDFCPAFWDWIVEAHYTGHVFSIEKVAIELHAMADELSEWADGRDEGFFLPPDQKVSRAFEKVSTWAQSRHYEPAAISTFMQGADYFLVAQALAGQHIIVTHEVASPSLKKIKIPDACLGLKIKFMNPFEMLRTERARFVLGQDRKG